MTTKERLLQELFKTHLSDKEVLALLDISRSTYQRWLAGKTAPSRAAISLLSTANMIISQIDFCRTEYYFYLNLTGHEKTTREYRMELESMDRVLRRICEHCWNIYEEHKSNV